MVIWFHEIGLGLFHLFYYYVIIEENVESKWHERLGHIEKDRTNMLAKEGHLESLNKFSFPNYRS